MHGTVLLYAALIVDVMIGSFARPHTSQQFRPRQLQSFVRPPQSLNASVELSIAHTHANTSAAKSAAFLVHIPSRQLRPYKLLVVGAPHTGKSALIDRFTAADSDNEGRFDSARAASQSIAVSQRLFPLGNGDELMAVECWDIPALPHIVPRYESLYLPNTDGCVIVADCTDVNSFSIIAQWQSKLLPLSIPMILVANKCDSINSKISARMIEESAKVFRCIKGMRTSAKDAINVAECFVTLVKEIQRRELKDSGDSMLRMLELSTDTTHTDNDSTPNRTAEPSQYLSTGNGAATRYHSRAPSTANPLTVPASPLPVPSPMQRIRQRVNTLLAQSLPAPKASAPSAAKFTVKSPHTTENDDVAINPTRLSIQKTKIAEIKQQGVDLRF